MGTALVGATVCAASGRAAPADLRAKAKANIRLGIDASVYSKLPLEEAVRRSLGPRAAGFLWFAVFVFSVVALPLALVRACGRLSSVAAGRMVPNLASGFSVALAPLGFAMWVAHISFHLFSGVLTPWPILLRIVRDLGLGTTVPDWNVPAPVFDGLPGLQILFLNAGLLCSLWILWRKSLALTRRAMPVFLPWALLAAALYAAGIWLIFQPIDIPGAINPP